MHGDDRFLIPEWMFALRMSRVEFATGEPAEVSRLRLLLMQLAALI